VEILSRDATAIDAREKAIKKEKPQKEACKKGRAKKGEKKPVELRRLVGKNTDFMRKIRNFVKF
jgi:hypothetical protein